MLWEGGFKKVKDVDDDELDRLERYLRVMDRMHEMMMRREQLLMLMHYRHVMTRYNEVVAHHWMHTHLPHVQPYVHQAATATHTHHY